jgi:hypothetical protein
MNPLKTVNVLLLGVLWSRQLNLKGIHPCCLLLKTQSYTTYIYKFSRLLLSALLTRHRQTFFLNQKPSSENLFLNIGLKSRSLYCKWMRSQSDAQGWVFTGSLFMKKNVLGWPVKTQTSSMENFYVACERLFFGLMQQTVECCWMCYNLKMNYQGLEVRVTCSEPCTVKGDSGVISLLAVYCQQHD